jgi:transcriptional regulator with XRE-family HTH domain
MPERQESGRTLRQLREQARLSQEELAAKAQVSRASVQNWEANRTTPRRAETRRLAAALGLTEQDLLAHVGRPVLEPLFNPRNPDLDPNGDSFPWGPIDRVINFERYTFVQYRFDKSSMASSDYSDHGSTFYQAYVDGRNTSHSFSTLDEAVVFAVAYRAEGPNTQAATYFMKMIATSTEGETQS